MRGRTRTALTEKRASLGESLPGSVIKSSPLAPSKMIHRRTMVRQDCPESKTYAHAREHTRPGVPWSPRERDKKRRKRKRKGKKKTSSSLFLDGMGALRISDIKADTRHDKATKISRRAYWKGRNFSVRLRSFFFPSLSLSFLVSSYLSWFLSHFLSLLSFLRSLLSVFLSSRCVWIFPRD